MSSCRIDNTSEKLLRAAYSMVISQLRAFCPFEGELNVRQFGAVTSLEMYVWKFKMANPNIRFSELVS